MQKDFLNAQISYALAAAIKIYINSYPRKMKVHTDQSSHCEEAGYYPCCQYSMHDVNIEKEKLLRIISLTYVKIKIIGVVSIEVNNYQKYCTKYKFHNILHIYIFHNYTI